MNVDGYSIDLLFKGFPGRSVQYGGLGWSSVALVRGEGHIALVDVGSFGMRSLLRAGLNELDLQPDDVTDVLLTHSHYDHAVNWTLFPRARIIVGANELSWSIKQPWGETPVPELYAIELQRQHRLCAIEDGTEVFPRVFARETPGHTPGHMVFVLNGNESDVIFTGDAAKNRAELLSKTADLSVDMEKSKASINEIWSWWRRSKNSILIPGHDIPMMLVEDRPRYIEQRHAALMAWFGEDLGAVSEIDLVADGTDDSPTQGSVRS